LCLPAATSAQRRAGIEIFTWVEGGFGMAREHPGVLMIWEAINPLLEDRDGRLRSVAGAWLARFDDAADVS
jgi:hypothetical protein